MHYANFTPSPKDNAFEQSPLRLLSNLLAEVLNVSITPEAVQNTDFKTLREDVEKKLITIQNAIQQSQNRLQAECGYSNQKTKELTEELRKSAFEQVKVTRDLRTQIAGLQSQVKTLITTNQSSMIERATQITIVEACAAMSHKRALSAEALVAKLKARIAELEASQLPSDFSFLPSELALQPAPCLHYQYPPSVEHSPSKKRRFSTGQSEQSVSTGRSEQSAPQIVRPSLAYTNGSYQP